MRIDWFNSYGSVLNWRFRKLLLEILLCLQSFLLECAVVRRVLYLFGSVDAFGFGCGKVSEVFDGNWGFSRLNLMVCL